MRNPIVAIVFLVNGGIKVKVSVMLVLGLTRDKSGNDHQNEILTCIIYLPSLSEKSEHKHLVPL